MWFLPALAQHDVSPPREACVHLQCSSTYWLLLGKAPPGPTAPTALRCVWLHQVAAIVVKRAGQSIGHDFLAKQCDQPHFSPSCAHPGGFSSQRIDTVACYNVWGYGYRPVRSLPRVVEEQAMCRVDSQMTDGWSRF